MIGCAVPCVTSVLRRVRGLRAIRPSQARNVVRIVETARTPASGRDPEGSPPALALDPTGPGLWLQCCFDQSHVLAPLGARAQTFERGQRWRFG